MLEVVFSHSAKGTLTLTQASVSPGGRREDIFCLPDDLSRGDLSENGFSMQRLHMFDAYPPSFSTLLHPCVESLYESRRELDRLLCCAKEAGAVRIWCSSEPAEACGLCRLLSLFAEEPRCPELFIVPLPAVTGAGDTIRQSIGWGGVSPEDVPSFLPLMQSVTPALLKAAAARWEVLQKENAPLRAVISGTLQSVPASFYDSYIEAALAQLGESFAEAELICRTLCSCPPGVSDVWLTLRAEEMIRRHRLLPLAEPAPDRPLYRRRLRKMCACI